MKKQSKKLVAVAYHEAGHAVAAYLLKMSFTSVTIVPKEEAWGSFHLRMPIWVNKKLEEKDYDDIKLQAWIKNNIVVTFAGMNAERLYTNRFNRIGARHDNEAAARLALTACNSSGEEAQAYLKWLGINAKRFIEKPFFQAGVEAVAQELIWRGTLNSREVADTARQGIQKAVLLNIQKVTTIEELLQ